MKTINGICTGLLVLGLLCISGIAAAQDETVLTDDIAAYNGPIGADSPLYGLKSALEDMDESFTANETERVDRQMEPCTAPALGSTPFTRTEPERVRRAGAQQLLDEDEPHQCHYLPVGIQLVPGSSTHRNRSKSTSSCLNTCWRTTRTTPVFSGHTTTASGWKRRSARRQWSGSTARWRRTTRPS